MQLIQLSEENGVGWAGFCAGRFYAIFLAVVAKCALGGYACLIVAPYHTKGARRHAIATAIADIRLYIDISKFVANDRSCWAGLQATCVCTVLAHIAHHQPVNGLAGSVTGARMLNEGHVSPGGGGKGPGIVVAIPREL